jgi:alkylation response protein AidB-like acyl-CoA dehydrogenase
VDFELTSDQVDLKEGVRKLLEGRFGIEAVREGFDRGRWSELAEAGVFALRLPEDDGGVGLGMAEAVLVFEELGRSLVPGPLVATELAAQLLPSAAWGDEVVGVVERTSSPLLVEHLDSLDRLLVVDDAGVHAVAASEVSGTALERPLDPLTPVSLVESLPRGERLGDADAFRVQGTILSAALAVGSAQAVTDLAVAYAKEREQFGRPIGSFQAVKHILADMAVRASVAQSAVYAAGVTYDDPSVGDPARAASAAKVTAGHAAVANGKGAIQVHGGMGFTWEVDAHLHLKRAWLLDTQFGSVDEHSERLAGLL